MGWILGHFHYDPFIAKMTKIIHTQKCLTVTHTQQEKFEYHVGSWGKIPENFYYVPHIAKIFWHKQFVHFFQNLVLRRYILVDSNTQWSQLSAKHLVALVQLRKFNISL